MIFNYEATTVQLWAGSQNQASIFTTVYMEVETIGLLTAACLLPYNCQVGAGATSGNIVHVVPPTLNSAIEPTDTILKMV